MVQSTVTYHLTPVEVWRSQENGELYRPEAFTRDGFIHCTDGEELALQVGNRYYTGDLRPYCLLTIEVTRLKTPVTYEDPGRLYPHIYGALNTDAITAVRAVTRDGEERFVAIGDPLPKS